MKGKKRKNETANMPAEKKKKDKGASEDQRSTELPQSLKRLLYEDWKMINQKKYVRK